MKKSVDLNLVKPQINPPFRVRHKILFVSILLVLFVLIVVSAFNLFTYARVALGYDLTLRVSSETNEVNLINGEKLSVNFNIERVSNILCKTKCFYTFLDSSQNIELANEEFTFYAEPSKVVSQTVEAPEKGEGEKIYALDVVCKNEATGICKTDGVNISRRSLITVNYYPSDNQLALKKSAEKELVSSQAVSMMLDDIINKKIPKIRQDYSFLVNSQEYNSLKVAYGGLSKAFSEALKLWEAGDYEGISMGEFNKILSQTESQLDSFKEDINLNVRDYNSMMADISAIAKSLDSLRSISLNETQSQKLESIIVDFNNKLNSFKISGNMADKKDIFGSIKSISLSEFQNESVNFGYNFSKVTVFNSTEIKIDIDGEDYFSNITLPQSKKLCCIEGLCNNCEIQKKYPIILLHGHNFNEDISADNIINDFALIQNKLSLIGYFNAGELFLYESRRQTPGALGKIAKPIAVRASYYFDFIKKEQNYKSVQIQSQNIDTYAIRLRDIIENVKYETQSPKVIIIAHSMGGLVVRRYIQIFGKESIGKIIFIDSPHGGITGRTSKYCSTFGAVSECADMDSKSFFINKLNNENTILPETYNIVGTGCQVDGQDSDGVVLIKNEILPETNNVKNFFINGACSGINFLHNSILNVEKYPEVLAVIQGALKN